MKLAYVKGKLNPGDVKRALQSKEHHQQVLDADGIMNQWRQLLTQHQIDKHEPQIAIALSCADMALRAMALGIKLPEERSYSGMQGLAHDLVVAVQAMGHNQVQSPWKDQAEALAVASSSSATAAGPGASIMLREVALDGSIKNQAALLHDAGFDIGCHLKRKADGQEGCLEGVDKGLVKIRLPDDPRLAKISVDSFLVEWQKHNPTAQPVMLTDLGQHDPINDHWKKVVAQAKIVIAMHEVAKKHKAAAKHVVLQLRPNRELHASMKMQKHKLVLAPVTAAFKSKTHGFDYVLAFPCMIFYILYLS